MPSYPLTFLIVLVGSVLAQTSLYIPGFDPQPLSADILGIDAQGRTTWAIHAGTQTDTSGEGGIIGTATLIEGPNDASLTYDVPGVFTRGISCSLSGNVAVCSDVESGVPLTETETFTRIQVQGGTTAPLATATNGPGNTATSKPGNSQPISTTSPSSTAKPTSNSASTLGPYLQPLSTIALAVAVYMQF